MLRGFAQKLLHLFRKLVFDIIFYGGCHMILAIYGTGGVGREVCEIALLINSKENRWSEIMYVDDFSKENTIRGLRILSYADMVNFKKNNIEFIIAVGDPEGKRKLFERVAQDGFSFANIYYPAVHIPQNTSIGVGVVIYSGTFVSCDVEIADNTLLMPNIYLAHDSKIGAHTVIGGGVNIGGSCIVGQENFLGSGAILREKIQTGNQVRIGMGSVVTKNIDSGVVAYGSPAQVIRRTVQQKLFR